MRYRASSARKKRNAPRSAMVTESAEQMGLAIAISATRASHAKNSVQICAVGRESAPMGDVCALQASSELIAQSNPAAAAMEIAPSLGPAFVTQGGWARNVRSVCSAQIRHAVVMVSARTEIVHARLDSLESLVRRLRKNVVRVLLAVFATEMLAFVFVMVCHVRTNPNLPPRKVMVVRKVEEKALVEKVGRQARWVVQASACSGEKMVEETMTTMTMMTMLR